MLLLADHCILRAAHSTCVKNQINTVLYLEGETMKNISFPSSKCYCIANGPPLYGHWVGNEVGLANGWLGNKYGLNLNSIFLGNTHTPTD